MTAGRVAWGLWGLAVALAAVALAFIVVNGPVAPEDAQYFDSTSGSRALDAFYVVAGLALPTVGALVASRQPGNAIGWLFCVGGGGGELEKVLIGYATHALVKAPGSLPGGALAALVADAIWVPAVFGPIALLLVLFPDGRLPSRHWRPYPWMLALLATAYVVSTVLNPGPLYLFPSTANPLGAEAGEGLIHAVVVVTSAAVIPVILLSTLGLAMRFRGSRGVERQQLKWLVYAAAAVALSVLPALLLDGVRVGGIEVGGTVFFALWATLPVAVGVAILRHRLYDIDVVINRTLVYGALTACLALCYWVAIVVLGQLLRPLTPESDLAIAGSTLAVAALFRPLRARIQTAVDRRFYRRRYDATRILEGFSARLRDELDLDALGSELRGVVHETLAPRHVSLWLRAP